MSTAAILSDPFGSSSHPGHGAAFLVLLAFLVSFLFIRTSARMIRAQVSWWPGNVETSGGLHLHHLVWGISLMILAGFLGFTLSTSPWYQIAALVFGIGIGLTLDEFALWVRLDDVYWTQQGRVSLDAVVITAALMALVVIGTRPFGLDDTGSITVTAITVAQAFVLAGISFLKGRIFLGVLALLIPFLGLWGTLRIAKPQSPWARRFYGEQKLEKARRRYPPDRRGIRIRDGFFDLIGGRPSEPDPPA